MTQISVKVISGKEKGVPPLPIEPQQKVVATIKKSYFFNKPLDLAAELATKKNNLILVEVKDYLCPKLQKSEEKRSCSNWKYYNSFIYISLII